MKPITKKAILFFTVVFVIVNIAFFFFFGLALSLASTSKEALEIVNSYATGYMLFLALFFFFFGASLTETH